MNNILVVTVHGTWGRGQKAKIPNWFQTGSDFTTRLVKSASSAKINCDVLPYLWSGRNSVAARDEAAQGLASFIEENFDHTLHDQVLVVGHSHGGSVALCMLKYLSSNPPLKIATLATPFLNIRPIETDIPYRFFAILFALSFALGANELFSYLKGSVLFGKYLSAASVVDLWLAAMGSYAAPVLAGLGGYKLAKVVLGWLIDKSISSEDVRPNAKASRLSEMTEVPEASRKKAKLLVLRGVADEAALTLAAGTLGTRITQLTVVLFSGTLRYIWRWIEPVMDRFGGIIIWTALILAMAYGIYDRATPHPHRLDEFLSYENQLSLLNIGALFALTLPAGALGLIYSSRIFMSVYGTEFLMGAGDCELVSESVPDWEDVCAITIASGDASAHLRHKLYGLHHTPVTLVAWLKSQRDGTPLSDQREWMWRNVSE